MRKIFHLQNIDIHFFENSGIFFNSSHSINNYSYSWITFDEITRYWYYFCKTYIIRTFSRISFIIIWIYLISWFYHEIEKYFFLFLRIWEMHDSEDCFIKWNFFSIHFIRLSSEIFELLYLYSIILILWLKMKFLVFKSFLDFIMRMSERNLNR